MNNLKIWPWSRIAKLEQTARNLLEVIGAQQARIAELEAAAERRRRPVIETSYSRDVINPPYCRDKQP